METAWGILGPEKVAIERRSRTLERTAWGHRTLSRGIGGQATKALCPRLSSSPVVPQRSAVSPVVPLSKGIGERP